jgi:hypothetical protein
MNQDIKTIALELQGFIWENCPNLKGTSITSHSELIDIVITFQSDIDACKTALESVNTYRVK